MSSINRTEWLGSYPPPKLGPRDWEFAEGYWWTPSCWTQEQYDPIDYSPMAPVGGNTAACPPGVLFKWIEAPPKNVFSSEEFEASVLLTINQSLIKANNLDGWGYFIPHYALYGCNIDQGHTTNLTCLPEVDTAEQSLKIRQLLPPDRRATNESQYEFTGRLKLTAGRHMIVSNVNFYNELGHRVILGLGCYTTATDRPDNLSGGAVAGIVLACILFGLVVVALGCMFYRYKQERNKVKRLEPRQYPKNMPQPASNLDALEGFDYDSIPRKSFMALEKLGNGAFGEVFKGALFHNNRAAMCAIKTLKEEHRKTLADKFLAEAEVMKGLKHPNIVRILGVSGEDEDERTEICIIMEYLPGGNLQQYLGSNPGLSTRERLWFCYELALGCEYVAGKYLVHRDIAARNCLLGDTGSKGYPTLKLSDFGLARVYDNEATYVMESGGLLPIRWMAVESITARQFTELTDVWAYGVTIWEIFSNGERPYANTQSFNLAASIAGGERLQCPELCPTNVFELMNSCWRRIPEDRPRFSDIVPKIKAIFDEQRDDSEEYQNSLRTTGHQVKDKDADGFMEYTDVALTSPMSKYAELVTSLPIDKSFSFSNGRTDNIKKTKPVPRDKPLASIDIDEGSSYGILTKRDEGRGLNEHTGSLRSNSTEIAVRGPTHEYALMNDHKEDPDYTYLADHSV
eukprot:CFRG3658T1